MSGLFVNAREKEGQGLTDIGYYTDERGVHAKVSELSQFVQEDRAYIVEVFETVPSGVHIRLKSENRRVVAETEGRIEKRTSGTNTYLYQSTQDPILPGKAENPHQTIEAYAEYALEHGKTKGISMEGVDWTDLLDV